MDYKKAGVDIEAGYKSVELMKEHVKKTMRPEVLGGLGGFAGAFDLSGIKNMEEPVLLSGTDGCGTKVKLAFVMDKHDTIGIDAVAMCVNDIACSGGEPLFFLDYIACGKNYPEKIASIVSGVAEGCLQSECALVGGETAEHPGLMPEDDYDLAGFAVGVVDKKDIIDGSTIKAGDTLIGIASSGVLIVYFHDSHCFSPYLLLAHQNETVLGPGHGTADKDDVVFRPHVHNFKALHGYLFGTPVARHLPALEHVRIDGL